MYFLSNTLHFAIVCVVIDVIDGQWFHSILHNTAVSHIIGRVSDTTITSCQLRCSRDDSCTSIALPKSPLLGEVGDCYLLKKGWDAINGSSGDALMLHILDVKLTPSGCRGNRIPITTDTCDPPPAPALPSNIALNKLVTVSNPSTALANLVDGIVSETFTARTDNGYPWVQVNLEQTATITKVLCYEGTVPGVYLLGSSVTIGLSPTEWTPCGIVSSDNMKIDAKRGNANYYEVICPTPIVGSLVKIQLNEEEDFISTNEVEVWGVYNT